VAGRVPAVLGLLAVAVAVGACGDDSGETVGGTATSPEPRAEASSSTPSPGSTPSESGSASETSSPSARPKPRGLVITTAGSDFGEMLFDRSGQAIYLFEKESGPRPACYAECAAAWPPVLTKGEPRAVGGADQSLLGTTERRGGGRQVTYAGHPLYYYAHEGKGEVLCHDVDQFGALWLVVTPSGRPAPH
jgi:predicted lipoprotein with Yx(FWY)xxD motif